MVRKAVKITMPIYSAPMHSEFCACQSVSAKTRKSVDEFARLRIRASAHSRAYGFTMAELVVVILVVSLFVLLAQMHLFGILRKNTFKAQIQQLVSTMRMAAAAAAESDRRYEVIIDLTEQGFMLRQITTPDLSQILEEEVIVENYFNDNCRVVYVEFDDGDYTNEGRAKFRAGHAGWQYGGKIVLLDEDQQPYTILINRLSIIVTLMPGEYDPLLPKRMEEVPF